MNKKRKHIVTKYKMFEDQSKYNRPTDYYRYRLIGNKFT